MPPERRGYNRDASDRKLDQSAEMADESGQARVTQHSSSPLHEPAEIRKHDDLGKDRLFEGRQQHDEAEKNSEKSRLAKDIARHNHPDDDNAPP